MHYTRKEITPRIYKEVLGNNEKKIRIKLKNEQKNLNKHFIKRKFKWSINI